MQYSNFKTRLKNQEVVIGTMISELRTPNIVRMLATAGLDFFLVDMEHGAYSWESMQAIIALGRACGIAPIVRIPEIRRETVLKPLDAGAAGLLVPVVDSAQQVKEVIMYAKYPPQGKRGTALRRGHSDYTVSNAQEYLKQANESTVIIIQIESQEALDNIDKILSIEGVDGAFVGPFDLSVNLGIPSAVNDPRMKKIYQKIIEAGRLYGVATGIQLFEMEAAKNLIAAGMQIISYSSDVNMIIDQTSQAIKELKMT